MPGKGSQQIQFQSSIYSHHQPQSSIYSHHQPWWCGGGGAWENASKSSASAPAPDQLNGSMTSILNVMPQSETNEGGGVAREYQNQNMEHTLSSTSFTLDKHLVPNPQMELAGPSVVLTPPYLDAQYGQMLATHAQPVMINPQFYGMHQPRVPLPIAMEEEPVYVNAKQYHGILRRRQSRAKAELAKKVIKNRKPYLHESRHLHAMRRARGNGGRFLNTKKQQNNNSSSSSDQGNHTGANPPTNSLSTQHLFINNNENLNSSNASQFTVQNMDRVQSFNIGYHTGNSLTTLYRPQLNGREGDCFGKERDPNRGFK